MRPEASAFRSVRVIGVLADDRVERLRPPLPREDLIRHELK